MENWNVAVCKRNHDADYFLLNKESTPIYVRGNNKFNVRQFLSILEDIDFPLKYTNGLDHIEFRRIKGYYGWYQDGVMVVGISPRRRMELIIETFVHEVAHHVDCTDQFSSRLTDERRKKGKFLVHREAKKSDSEYFARGFERFYSIHKSDKKNLRTKNPKLYRIILKLHRKFKSK